MKCDELKQVENPIKWGLYYDKSEVDAAIAELKAENTQFKKKLDKAIAERDGNQVCIDALKAKLEDVQASMYADVVDANMEVRRLKRALFIAHAIKARFKWWWMSECKHNESCKLSPDPRKIKKFTNSAWVCSKSQEKCRAKAEEYK